MLPLEPVKLRPSRPMDSASKILPAGAAGSVALASAWSAITGGAAITARAAQRLHAGREVGTRIFISNTPSSLSGLVV